jgi:transposase
MCLKERAWYKHSPREMKVGKSRCIVHTEEGSEEFREWLVDLRQRTGKEPLVVLETTEHYHRGLVA